LQVSLPRFVAQDPHAAARFAELQFDPFLREVSLRTVAQAWARVDASAAAQWALALGDTLEADAALSQVALERAIIDPRQAIELLERRGRGTASTFAWEGVLSRWIAVDSAAALNWLQAQPADSSRDEILQRATFQLASIDPRSAIDLTEMPFVDDRKRREALASIARLWNHKDPAAAREWALGLDFDDRNRVMQELNASGPSTATLQ
jgi:hypothetical protein